MVKNLKKIILLVIIFLIGAAIGAGAMLLREKSYWDNEDKKLAEYFTKKQEEINSGIYSLADGNFYLNGDDRNAYWEVKDSTIKLFADEEQLLTYYYASCAAVEQRGASVSGTLSGNTDFTSIPNYEN
ncbi:MAG: hypothetical protein K2G87_10550, partial [Oscillospiraceae bacterium]|nr:hypothetical protein [Oscillospiraceae bacterium]